MLVAFIILLLFDLAGNLIQRYWSIPAPGALIGMALLTVLLYFKPRFATQGVHGTSSALTRNIGLFFVPAGVGVIAEGRHLRLEWLPITVALLVSTAASLLVSASVMQWRCAARKRHEMAALPGESER